MVVVLTGSNAYLLQDYLHKLIDDFTEKYGDSIERFDGAELTSSDSILDAVRSVSFLDPRKMVIVRDFAQNKDILDKIESVVEQTAETTNLVLIDPKLDKRTAAFKYLKSSCDVKSFDEKLPYELENWVKEEAKNLGVTIGGPEARYLVERVGLNQQLIAQELTKMSISSKVITRNLIDELVDATPQSKVFDMLGALFIGDGKKAFELYKDQRAQGEEPQKLLAMITWQLQQLTLAVFSEIKSVEAMKSLGMSPYSAQKALQMAEHISRSDLKFYIRELAEIDMQSKTSADVESALAVYFSEVIERQRS